MTGSPDSLEDPEPPRKAGTKITRCIACNKLMQCDSLGQVNQQFAMADGFAPCLALSAGVVHLAIYTFEDFAASRDHDSKS